MPYPIAGGGGVLGLLYANNHWNREIFSTDYQTCTVSLLDRICSKVNRQENTKVKLWNILEYQAIDTVDVKV